MSIPSYRNIVLNLEQNTVLTLTVDSDSISEVKKKLSQAKCRMGIEGRMTFSESPAKQESQTDVTVALLPATNSKILAVTKEGI